jgi:membrane protein YfhO
MRMRFSSQPAAQTGSANHDDWLSAPRFAVLLALLVLVTYPQVVLGLQTFVYRDFGIFSYPLAQYFRESFWRGEIPLWNPLNNCGVPFLAQWNTQVLYPPSLFYLLLPLSWSLGVFCLLHLFWGGLGMFLLARDWSRNSLAAAFAGIVFAFNGLTLNSLIWPSIICALAWMPWVVRFAEQARCEGGKKIGVAAIIGALQMLTGGTEVVLLTWIFLGTLALRSFLLGEIPRVKMLLRLVAVVLLVSGLCAAQLLPFFELLKASRQQQEISAATWPMPVTGLANFFVPLFHCHSYQGIFTQDNQSWTNSYYVGVMAVVLAIGAVWLVSDGRIRWLAALAAFCLVLAVGEATPVYGWLSRHVSVIGLMRFPVKFVILPVFVLPLLAALMLAKKIIRTDEKFRPLALITVWFVVVAGILGLLGWCWHSEPPGADRTTTLTNGLARIFFFTAMTAVWFLANPSASSKPRWLWPLLFLLLAWLDLFQQMPLPPTVNRAVYQRQFPRPLPAPQFGLSRAWVASGVRDTFYHSMLSDASTDYVGRRLAFFADCNLLENAPKCDGFYPLYLTDYAVLFYNFYRDDQPAEPLLDFLGVSQVFDRQTNQLAWTPRTNFLPLLTCGQKPFFAGDFSTLQSLTNADFRPGEQVFLPPEAKPLITATNVVSAKISDAHYSAQKIEAEVTSAAATMLVAAQIYYRPWHAYVDGQRVPLWRANYAFQAVEIPAGSHRVKLVYEDRQFYLGAAISLTTLAGCLIFFRPRRHAKP